MGSDGLKVISTHDAEDTLVKEGLFPLLVCDLWEHAYYLDYQNDRKGFLKAWLDGAANYFFGEQQMFAADGQISADGGNGFKYPEPNAFEGRGEPAGHEDRPTV
jgi:Fe-Mn family superoxide dismutase